MLSGWASRHGPVALATAVSSAAASRPRLGRATTEAARGLIECLASYHDDHNVASETSSAAAASSTPRFTAELGRIVQQLLLVPAQPDNAGHSPSDPWTFRFLHLPTPTTQPTACLAVQESSTAVPKPVNT